MDIIIETWPTDSTGQPNGIDDALHAGLEIETTDAAAWLEHVQPATETATVDGHAVQFPVITMAELMAGEYVVEYHCLGVLAAGEPAVVGGQQKAFKTSLCLDLALSMATRTPYLGHFEVPEPIPVHFFAGEGGLAVIQDALRRIGDAKNVDVAKCDTLTVTNCVPRFDSAAHLDAIRRHIEQYGPAVIFFDPSYLAMSGADTSNVFSMGERLRGLSEACLAANCTPVLLHHLRKNRADRYAPADLDDLSMAGFAEYAGQWMLLSRRRPYDPDAPDHALWLTLGGRTGHSSQWGLDVHEGTLDDPLGRVWETTLRKQSDIIEEEESKKLDRADHKRKSQEDRDRKEADNLYHWLYAARPHGKTRHEIRAYLRSGDAKRDRLISILEADGHVEACEVHRPCNTGMKAHQGYKAIVKHEFEGCFD